MTARPEPRGLARALLVLAIAIYRRHLSGRGPLRRVRCSFEQTETCSAYGLRVAQEAGTAGEAGRLIATRLARCRGAALWVARGRVYFGTLYDRPEAELWVLEHEARELGVTCAALVKARRVLDRSALAAPRVPSDDRALGGSPMPRILLRAGDGDGAERRRVARARQVAAIGGALVLASVGLVVLSTTLALAVGIVAALGVALGMWTWARAAARRATWTERRAELDAARCFQLAAPRPDPR